MFTLIRYSRLLLTLLVLAVFTAPLAAAPHTSAGRTPSSEPGESLPAAAVEQQPPASPEMGLLIIIGVVGFLVLVAWLIARVGDDNRNGGDHTLL
jgi:hypothetical protein